MPKTISRRTQKRLKVKDGTFAVLFQDSSKLGEVLDISMAGFSFRYSDSEFIDNDRGGHAYLYQNSRKPLVGFKDIDIFLVDSGIYIDKIPCQIISNIDDSFESANSIPLKRCGIQFDELLPEQVSDLEYFIKHCTVDSE